MARPISTFICRLEIKSLTSQMLRKEQCSLCLVACIKKRFSRNLEGPLTPPKSLYDYRKNIHALVTGMTSNNY
eukprot:1142855-Pelagomonas_calceolata.AAC.1